MVGADVSPWHPSALQRKYHRPSPSQSLRQGSRPSQQNSSSPVIHGSPSSFVHVVGAEVGAVVGAEVGADVGADVGAVVGAEVGAEVGAVVGADVGAVVGAEVGAEVGANVSPWHLALQRKYQRPSPSQSSRQDSRPSQQGASSPVFHGSESSIVHCTGGREVGTAVASPEQLSVVSQMKYSGPSSLPHCPRHGTSPSQQGTSSPDANGSSPCSVQDGLGEGSVTPSPDTQTPPWQMPHGTEWQTDASDLGEGTPQVPVKVVR